MELDDDSPIMVRPGLGYNIFRRLCGARPPQCHRCRVQLGGRVADSPAQAHCPRILSAFTTMSLRRLQGLLPDPKADGTAQAVAGDSGGPALVGQTPPDIQLPKDWEPHHTPCYWFAVTAWCVTAYLTGLDSPRSMLKPPPPQSCHLPARLV